MVRNLLITSLLLMSSIANAEKPSVFIIADNRIQIHGQIGDLLKQQLSPNNSVQIFHNQKISRKQIILAQPALIISLGTHSSQLAPPSSIPTLYALISKNRSKELISCQLPNCSKKEIHHNSYSIYLDQPIDRQLRFLSLLLPKAKKIGVLTATFSNNKLNSLKNEATKLNLLVKNQTIHSPTTLSSQLNKLIVDIDVLFTLPDPLIHNKHSISNLLLTTYRHNIPVIGFSRSYVTAGAIAAIYSSPGQIAQHISELSQTILLSPKQLTKRYFPPKYFSIALNKSVARSLELNLPEKQSLKSQLLAIEK